MTQKRLRKAMRRRIVKKSEPQRDPYVDKQLEKQEFLKRVQKDLKPLNGDPKGIKKMQKLSKKQLELLKNEQLRQLYDEREVLKKQAEEVKRLEWLNKKANHSLGLKRKGATAEKRRPRSQKRNFVQNGEY